MQRCLFPVDFLNLRCYGFCISMNCINDQPLTLPDPSERIVSLHIPDDLHKFHPDLFVWYICFSIRLIISQISQMDQQCQYVVRFWNVTRSLANPFVSTLTAPPPISSATILESPSKSRLMYPIRLSAAEV